MDNSLVNISASLKASTQSNALLQLVTFKLENEEYAVDILKVQEINRMTAITKIPNAPYHVDGVVNLRGRVIPVVNLRKKLGLPDNEHTEQSRIMIMDIEGTTMGLIVDGVDEVLRIPADIVEPPPPLSMGISNEFMKGIAKLENRLIILVDLKNLFGVGDIAMIEDTTTNINE